jgi:hypothetical protein
MRKALLSSLYAIAAVLACFMIGGALYYGEIGAAILWVLLFSPIIINALRTPRQIGGAPLPAAQEPIQFSALSVSQRKPTKRPIPAESIASGATTIFKWAGHLCLALTVIFAASTPFYIQVAGYALAYSILGAILCYGLSAAFR